MHDAVAAARLRNQWLVRPHASASPADVVAWFGAVQAQEYTAAKWALALRIGARTTATVIARALDQGRILRTHVLRPTWHFVTPSDIVWMLELTAPRVRRAMAFAFRYYGIDPALCVRASRIFVREIEAAGPLTRAELGARLQRAKMPGAGFPLACLIMDAELEGLICSGPQRGRQMTYALLADRAPRARRLRGDEALGELTRRYFGSHGPATVRDFAWWAGLTRREAARGLDITRATRRPIDDLVYWSLGALPSVRIPRNLVHLLPIYDEYLVAYRDLAAVPRVGGRHEPSVVAGGRIVGSWKAVRKGATRVVQSGVDRSLSAGQRRALVARIRQYQRFAGA